MQRAFQLAEYGRGQVSPNPMVGCVLVANGAIIGEGWHRQYGGPHAEVQAVQDAQQKGNAHLLPGATAYVTLEPCSHFGKTPPCASLLIRHRIGRVVVANDDPNPLVAGRGLTLLAEAGMEVLTGVLAGIGTELNSRFFSFFLKKRPYIILKWAETADGYIAAEGGKPVAISNRSSSIQVHRWRSEEDSILIGRQTALTDNPSLNVRHWHGRDPVRIVLDRHRTLPGSLRLYDQSQPTIVYTYQNGTKVPEFPERYGPPGEVSYASIVPGTDELQQILTDLHQRKIQSVLVEGGSQIHQAFLAADLWDELRRCQSPLRLGKGVKAPPVAGTLLKSDYIAGDLWTYYRP